MMNMKRLKPYYLNLYKYENVSRPFGNQLGYTLAKRCFLLRKRSKTIIFLKMKKNQELWLIAECCHDFFNKGLFMSLKDLIVILSCKLQRGHSTEMVLLTWRSPWGTFEIGSYRGEQ